MLNNFNPLPLVCFYSDVFMCEQTFLDNDTSYWHLRLLVKGQLIDACHWTHSQFPTLQYRNNDSILVSGFWITERQANLQILRSRVINSFAANDAIYEPGEPQQLEFDFGDEFKLKNQAKP